ncbi:hypothetical protein [Nocardia amikacinitolerans]|uniref:hypothetical protein n=1 Tax=Nocardia amikacinitolerans TaxID=756689 RepID=UPI0012ED311A|nr:hypothetical protein [Nocardia amikacinitolerans]
MSAIYAAGTLQGHGSSYDNRNGRKTSMSTQTVLAQQLSPPVLKPNLANFARGITALVVGLSVHVFAMLVISTLGASLVVTVLAPLCLSSWLLIPGVPVTITGVARVIRLKADLPRRQAMWRVWNNLYFCSRDDVAFLPDGPPFHPSRLPGFMATTSGPFVGIAAV